MSGWFKLACLNRAQLSTFIPRFSVMLVLSPLNRSQASGGNCKALITCVQGPQSNTAESWVEQTIRENIWLWMIGLLKMMKMGWRWACDMLRYAAMLHSSVIFRKVADAQNMRWIQEKRGKQNLWNFQSPGLIVRELRANFRCGSTLPLTNPLVSYSENGAKWIIGGLFGQLPKKKNDCDVQPSHEITNQIHMAYLDGRLELLKVGACPATTPLATLLIHCISFIACIS